MTLYEYLDRISWEELKHDGSPHYKGKGAEQVDLYRSIGQRTLATWALTGAQRRASRNLKAMERGDTININDVRKVIHELTFLYVALRDSDTI